MKHIVQGAVRFQNEVFQEHANLFSKLASNQSPEVLFITCSDSRIDPNLITQADPGELFICRNAGNIVPPHLRQAGGMTASIEYAVQALGVSHVVVCGHTDCGAMKASMNMESLQDFPHVCDWLAHSEAAVSVINHKYKNASEQEQLEKLTEQNVILQLQHLSTHPYIAARLATQEIELHGWVYEIGSGEIRVWDAASKSFAPFAEHYQALLSASA